MIQERSQKLISKYCHFSLNYSSNPSLKCFEHRSPSNFNFLGPFLSDLRLVWWKHYDQRMEGSEGWRKLTTSLHINWTPSETPLTVLEGSPCSEWRKVKMTPLEDKGGSERNCQDWWTNTNHTLDDLKTGSGSVSLNVQLMGLFRRLSCLKSVFTNFMCVFSHSFKM